jgi:hypothetical protein
MMPTPLLSSHHTAPELSTAGRLVEALALLAAAAV